MLFERCALWMLGMNASLVATSPQTSVKSESRSSPDLEESTRSKAVNSHPPSSSSDHAYLPEIIFFQFKTGTLTPTEVHIIYIWTTYINNTDLYINWIRFKWNIVRRMKSTIWLIMIWRKLDTGDKIWTIKLIAQNLKKCFTLKNLLYGHTYSNSSRKHSEAVYLREEWVSE